MPTNYGEDILSALLDMITEGKEITIDSVEVIDLSDSQAFVRWGNLTELYDASGNVIGEVVPYSTEVAGTTYTANALVEVEGGALTATGWGVATTTSTLAATIGAAAFGIVAGMGLYSAFPDFFTSLSDSIFGSFVDNLPVIYFNHDGKLCIDQRSLDNIQNYLANQANMYMESRVPEFSKLTALRNYLNETINQRTHTIQISDNITLSELLYALDNGPDAFYFKTYPYMTIDNEFTREDTGIPNPYYYSNFERLFRAWTYLFGSGTIAAQQRRSYLLDWLNEFWSNQMVFGVYHENQSSEMVIVLTPIEAYNRLYQRSYQYLQANLGPHLGISSSYRLVKVKDITGGMEAYDSSSYSYMFTQTPWRYVIRGAKADGDQQFIFNGTTYTIPDNESFSSSPYGDLQDLVEGFSTGIVTYEPESSWSQFYGRQANDRDSTNKTTVLPNQNKINDKEYFHTDYVDPNGYYYARQMPIEPRISAYMPAYNSSTHFGELGLGALFSDARKRSWVSPETTIPDPSQ